MSWSSFVERVEKVVDDLTTLDVTTVSGTIAITGTSDQVKLKGLVGTIEEATAASADIEVIAFTHVDLDQDAVNFVAKGAEEKRALLDAHARLLAASSEARTSFIRLVAEILK